VGRLGSLLAGVFAGCALAAPAAVAAPAGLPEVGSGHRPGPDALYMPAPVAPQLQNTGPWRAEPILISGAAAYRDGEFLYQDHLLDDRGAAGVPDPGDPHDFGTYLYSPKTGTLTYPTDPAFANNAADLVELRVKPLAQATAFRVTLNTLADPERTAFTIALGTSESARQWPHGAGASSPAELFLTVHGTTADLVDAASGRLRGKPTVSVDVARRQFEVRVPHSAWNPGRGTHRMAAGVGLWDPEAGTYLRPAAQATATLPGGANALGTALFNVAFRFDEPLPDINQGPGITMADAAVGAAVLATWWREKAQGDALRIGDVSPFFADVDFGKLADRLTDESRVPDSGPMNRILASRHSTGQGVDHSKVCFDLASQVSEGAACEGRIQGQLQPYGLYVPERPAPVRGYGITLLLHSLSANHNQYMDSRNQSQLGERGAGSLVITPSGRGPDGFYAGLAEADTFETWADVARHYPVDPDWTTVSGYSMGGFGTFRLLARWPDLFARGFSTVGLPGTVDDQLISLRNTPLMTWAAAADELVHITETEATAEAMTELGLQFVHDLFPAADHLTLATNDEYGPAAAFLGEHRVDRDPPHVSYVVDGREDSTAAHAVADHAYWISGLKVRDAEANPLATIDARSEGFGVGDPEPGGVTRSAGTLDGGSRGPLPYARRAQEWGPAPAAPEADRIVVQAANLATATIDAPRARVSCSPQLDISSDGPLDLRVICARPRKRTADCGPATAKLPRVQGGRVVSVRVVRAGERIKARRGRNLRRISFARPSREAFTVRIRARTNGPKPHTITVVRRFHAC
jgi:C-terminal binding-module, SLH-like, of glucodextranase